MTEGLLRFCGKPLKLHREFEALASLTGSEEATRSRTYSIRPDENRSGTAPIRFDEQSWGTFSRTMRTIPCDRMTP
jgi:hypothetical protein